MGVAIPDPPHDTFSRGGSKNIKSPRTYSVATVSEGSSSQKHRRQFSSCQSLSKSPRLNSKLPSESRYTLGTRWHPSESSQRSSFSSNEMDHRLTGSSSRFSSHARDAPCAPTRAAFSARRCFRQSSDETRRLI